MPLVLFTQDSVNRIDIPKGYVDLPKLRDIMPGSILRGAKRHTFLAELGITDSAPNSIVRHLQPKGMTKKVIAGIRVAHGDDIANITEEFKQCAALVNLGITSVDSYNNPVNNGLRNDAGILLRTNTIPCPYCLGAALIADVKRGAELHKDISAILPKAK